MSEWMTVLSQYGLLGIVLGAVGYFLNQYLPKQAADFRASLNELTMAFSERGDKDRNHFDEVLQKIEARAESSMEKAEQRCADANAKNVDAINALHRRLTEIQANKE